MREENPQPPAFWRNGELATSEPWSEMLQPAGSGGQRPSLEAGKFGSAAGSSLLLPICVFSYLLPK